MENSAENFIQLIDRLLLEKHYDGIPLLFQNNRNSANLKDNCSEIIRVCMKYLNDDNYNRNFDLYSAADNLMKLIGQHGGQEEVLFEFLEIIETTKSDNVFTSLLRALQICLIRHTDNKVRALEWSLNSIHTYITEMEIPLILETGYDEDIENVLEDEPKVNRILVTYITTTLFYEPILMEFYPKIIVNIFKDTKITRKNVIICFLLQLLGKPLALLDLTNGQKHTNTYSLQCAKHLIEHITRLIGDPYYFLSYTEKRCRWITTLSSDNGVYELVLRDIFLIEEKLPIISLGIYYYLLFVENLLPDYSPKIYKTIYCFEMCLYLVNALLKCEQPIIQYKGILLGIKIIDNLHNELINSESLELRIHSIFCQTLQNVLIYSTLERNRRMGIILLRKYILQFEDDARFIVLKNLIQTTQHNGLLGYLITIYKNLIANLLSTNEEIIELPYYYCGKEFSDIFLKYICKLQQNTETDLIQNSDQIISGLNICRYFILSDKNNYTGFWNIIDNIKSQFFEPLRKAIDLSRAHYKAEILNVQNDNIEDDMKNLIQISMLSGEDFPDLTKERKLEMLRSAMITFDLIESLLARINECLNINN